MSGTSCQTTSKLLKCCANQRANFHKGAADVSQVTPTDETARPHCSSESCSTRHGFFPAGLDGELDEIKFQEQAQTLSDHDVKLELTELAASSINSEVASHSAAADIDPSTKLPFQAPGVRGTFPFGNYPHYYSDERHRGSRNDPRIDALVAVHWLGTTAENSSSTRQVDDSLNEPFFRALLKRKGHGRALDIGCNSGVATLALAKRLKFGSVVGVEVDPALIARADALCKEHVSREKRQNAKLISAARPLQVPSFTFLCADVTQLKPADVCVLDAEGDRAGGLFDVCFCLSVSKWIHLNAGDDGIRKLFALCAGVLRPGGVLVLEPQTWSSYRKNAKADHTGAHRRMLRQLQLRPRDFEAELEKLGFSCTEVARQSSDPERWERDAGDLLKDSADNRKRKHYQTAPAIRGEFFQRPLLWCVRQ